MMTLVIVGSVQAWGYDAGIAVQSEKGIAMHVYINGKLYHNQTSRYLRLRSMAGNFHLEVKVMNPVDKRWYTVSKDIRITKGYEFQYKVVFENGRPVVREIKKYPVYSRYFLNQGLYNTHPIS